MDASFRIFLTGGTGFFGRALLRKWLGQCQLGLALPSVTVLTRSSASFLADYPEFSGLSWLKFHEGDIGNLESLPGGESFSHILHAAADSTLGPQRSPLQRYDQIVGGTRNLLNFAVACAAKRFLLTSSGGVYGPQPAGMDRIPEDWLGMPDPTNPANAYGVGKRAAEHLCALYFATHGIETVIARCFAFVGEDLPLDVHFAIGNFIRDALWAEEIVVAGDGTPLRSYLDQRDLAHWLLMLLADGRPNRAYNVGSNQALSIAELARLVGKIVSPGKPVRILGEPTGSPGRNIYVPDITRAREELGLTVTIGLETAIADTANAAIRRGASGSRQCR
jgi:dTDP-glucose 4,6-dehydratase